MLEDLEHLDYLEHLFPLPIEMLRHRWFIPAYVDRASRRHLRVRRVAEVVERVVDALEGRGDGAATIGNAGLVEPLSRSRMPDLASRLRRDLQAGGVVISEMGKASSGRHTVVTLRLPSGAKSALESVSCAAAGVDFICLAEAG